MNHIASLHNTAECRVLEHLSTSHERYSLVFTRSASDATRLLAHSLQFFSSSGADDEDGVGFGGNKGDEDGVNEDYEDGGGCGGNEGDDNDGGCDGYNGGDDEKVSDETDSVRPGKSKGSDSHATKNNIVVGTEENEKNLYKNKITKNNNSCNNTKNKNNKIIETKQNKIRNNKIKNFKNNKKTITSKRPCFAYLDDNHTSVVGMRGVFAGRGGGVGYGDDDSHFSSHHHPSSHLLHHHPPSALPPSHHRVECICVTLEEVDESIKMVKTWVWWSKWVGVME